MWFYAQTLQGPEQAICDIQCLCHIIKYNADADKRFFLTQRFCYFLFVADNNLNKTSGLVILQAGILITTL